MKINSILNAAAMIAAIGMASSCCQQKVQPTTENPHACITSEEKVQSITTLKELDPDRLYEMTYTADYKLDKLIESNVTDLESFAKFLCAEMFDVAPTEPMFSIFNSGCSAYAATEITRGDFLMGRNYDYCHKEKDGEAPITALMVRTAPEGGKKSISMVDSYWLGFHKGFYKNGVTDISMLIAAPYELMDGVNEDGFAIGVLHLDGKATEQNEEGKRPLWTNVMMRKLLDTVSTVEEAVNMLKDYNITMVTPASGNFHFFIADATGDFAIIEYSYADLEATETGLPNVLKIFRGEDCDRYVTNFYVDPDIAEHPTLGPLGKHGLWRYDTLRVNLAKYENKVTDEQAMDLLKAVSQDANPEEPTSHTQWSSLYNLTQKKLDVCILQEYENKFTFSIEAD